MNSHALPPQTTMTTNTTDLVGRLTQVGLPATAQNLDDFLARAGKGRWSPVQILEEIARLEQIEKTRRSLQGRLQRARIGRFKPIADYDWNWPKKVERDLIERALTLEFIREGRNLVLLGTNGLGKTMLVKNIAHQAVLAGFSALFTTAAELIEDLRSRSPETLRRRLARYTRPHLLVIDEVGYLSYDSHAADLLYKVVDRRYERPGAREDSSRSILLTTNLAFRDWNTVFPNATSIATLLDKLTHHADVTMIEGDSYRKHESQKEAAARRKKR
ncbi:MAG: ATP-binding protein [candidate division NC10 bacterium]